MVTAWRQIDRETGRYGENLIDATSALADPANPDATHRYVAGVAVNGEQVPIVNYAARAVAETQRRYYRKYEHAADDREFHLWPVQKIDLG